VHGVLTRSRLRERGWGMRELTAGRQIGAEEGKGVEESGEEGRADVSRRQRSILRPSPSLAPAAAAAAAAAAREAAVAAAVCCPRSPALLPAIRTVLYRT